MLREYDFTIITRGDLPEADHKKLVEDYENLMTADGGQVLKRDDWGMKRLAFPMKKAFRGHYINYDFLGLPDNLAEMERLMRIDDNVLRYMLVRLSGDAKKPIDVEARKAEIVEADKKAAEQEQNERKNSR